MGFTFSSKSGSVGYFADSTPYLLKGKERAGHADTREIVRQKPPLNKKLVDEYGGVDILILNIGGVFAEKENPYRKMGVEGAIDILNYLKETGKAPRIAVLNHWWYHTGVHNKQLQKIYKREKVKNFRDLAAKQIEKKTGIKTIAAHDLSFLQMTKKGFVYRNPY